jgi:ribonuclease J
MYTAHILEATGNAHIPQAGWDDIRVYLPEAQKRRIVMDQSFALSDRFKPDRIYPENLAAVASRSVMLFRPSMQVDVDKAGCLGGACLVYSMWDGYLRQERNESFLGWLRERGIPLHQYHTSGHASLKDLKRLRDAFPEAVVVPIHTQNPKVYADLFGRVATHEDGEWWEV